MPAALSPRLVTVLPMSADWTWELLDRRGRPMTREHLPRSTFPSQSEAESYLGEEWAALLAAGVDAVNLREGRNVVYGPMSLHPSE